MALLVASVRRAHYHTLHNMRRQAHSDELTNAFTRSMLTVPSKVSGKVKVELYKGSITIVALSSPNSLFSQQLATFERTQGAGTCDSIMYSLCTHHSTSPLTNDSHLLLLRHRQVQPERQRWLHRAVHSAHADRCTGQQQADGSHHSDIAVSQYRCSHSSLVVW